MGHPFPSPIASDIDRVRFCHSVILAVQYKKAASMMLIIHGLAFLFAGKCLNLESDSHRPYISNRLLRQYFPKNTDFKKTTNDQI
jgi:hypothetical protein